MHSTSNVVVHVHVDFKISLLKSDGPLASDVSLTVMSQSIFSTEIDVRAEVGSNFFQVNLKLPKRLVAVFYARSAWI